MFIDGIEFAGHSVIIALGVTIDGTKVPPGLGRVDREFHRGNGSALGPRGSKEDRNSV
jgi:hypothetical protein